jgi:hypothetical protein
MNNLDHRELTDNELDVVSGGLATPGGSWIHPNSGIGGVGGTAPSAPANAAAMAAWGDLLRQYGF